MYGSQKNAPVQHDATQAQAARYLPGGLYGKLQ